MYNYKSKELFINLDEKDIPPSNHPDYIALRDWEKKKSIEGVTINGIHIWGSLYYTINHHKINIETNNILKPFDTLNPKLRDNEWIIHEAYNQAKAEKLGMCLGATRQCGKSEFIVSEASRQLFLFPGSEVVGVFTTKPDKQTFTKKLQIAIQHNTKFLVVPNIDKDLNKEYIRFGLTQKDNEPFIYSSLYLFLNSEGNNTEVAAGKTISHFFMDEIGKNNMKETYEAVLPAIDGDYGLRCSPILVFTGGDVVKSQDARGIYFNPEANHIKAYEYNGKKSGLFLPGEYKMGFKEEVPLVDFYNKRYNTQIDNKNKELNNTKIWATDWDRAVKTLDNAEIEAKQESLLTYQKRKMYAPRKVSDIFLQTEANPFSHLATEFDMLLEYLDAHPQVKARPVDLIGDEESGVAFKFSEKPLLEDYPLSKTEEWKKDSAFAIIDPPRLQVGTKLYVVGCLPPGEKVMTSKGLKDIEKVTLEDKLINSEGEEVIINNLQMYEVKDEELYTLKLSNTFRKTSFTGEHPILRSKHYLDNWCYKIKEDNFNFNFTEAKYLEVDDWIKIPNMYNSINNFDIDTLWNQDTRIDFQVDSPLKDKDFWWFIGIFLGDGWVISKSSSIQVCFSDKELVNFEKYKVIVKRLFNREVCTKQKIGCIEALFVSKSLGKFLDDNFAKYAASKVIPEWVKKIDTECKVALIQGYLNSDGCVTKSSRGYYAMEFVSISLQLLEGIQDIGFSIGLISNLNLLRRAKSHFINDRESQTKETYTLTFMHNPTLDFIKLANDPTDLKLSKVDLNNLKPTRAKSKKGCFFSKDNKYIYFQVKNIEESEFTGNVYNFECDTNTFLCHHITTHNCDPFNMIKAGKEASLGSFYIMRRDTSDFNDPFGGKIVAWYNGRKDITHFRKTLLQAMLLYGALDGCCTLLHEASDDSLTQWFNEKHLGYMLEETYSLSKEINPNSTNLNNKGMRPTPRTQAYYLGKLLDYCEEDIDGKLGLWRIKDPFVIKQLMSFEGDLGVVDALVGLGHTIIHYYKERRYLPQIYKGEKKKEKEKIIYNSFGFHNNYSNFGESNQSSII